MTEIHPFRLTPLRVLQICIAVSLLLLAALAWVYFAVPISNAYWNDKVADFLIIAAALGACLVGTKVARSFERQEPPWRIWWSFAIGLWCWLAGELIGLVYDAIYWESGYPSLTLIDLFWILGYMWLGLSLYYQYRLIYGRQNKRGTRDYAGLIVLALLITALLTNLAVSVGLAEGYPWLILFITILYPVFDLAEGVGAIWLSLLFGRGHWSRPWWGLILFALADSINSFYWLGGYSRLSPVVQTIFNVITNLAYPAGYLVAGLALLVNYYLIRDGEIAGLVTPKWRD